MAGAAIEEDSRACSKRSLSQLDTGLTSAEAGAVQGHVPGLRGVLDDVLEVVAVAHMVLHGVSALAQPVLASDVQVGVDLWMVIGSTIEQWQRDNLGCAMERIEAEESDGIASA